MSCLECQAPIEEGSGLWLCKRCNDRHERAADRMIEKGERRMPTRTKWRKEVNLHDALEATKAAGGRAQLTIDGKGRYIVDYGRHFPRQGYYATVKDAARGIMEYAREQEREA